MLDYVILQYVIQYDITLYSTMQYAMTCEAAHREVGAETPGAQGDGLLIIMVIIMIIIMITVIIIMKILIITLRKENENN